MKSIFISFCIILFFSSCSAVFEKSIENSTINIYTPADSFSTKIYSQQFYWDPVEHAINYKLQIAKPSFNSGLIQAIVIDTTITTNKITIPLSPGEYEWRLRAQNGSTETVYYTRKLFITEASFNERAMLMSSPSSTSTVISTFTSAVLFKWLTVSGAQNYYLEIDTLTGSFSNPIIVQIDKSLNEKTRAFPVRGRYIWRMHADSLGVKSLYSVVGNIDFKMDTVSLSTPANNAIGQSQSLELRWTKPTLSMSTDIYKYKVCIYSSNSDADLLTSYPFVNGEEKLAITVLEKNKAYYWAVQVVDQNGVTSNFTKKYKFTTAP